MMRESVVDCSYYLSTQLASSGSNFTSAGFLIVVIAVLININIIGIIIIIIHCHDNLKCNFPHSSLFEQRVGSPEKMLSSEKVCNL